MSNPFQRFDDERAALVAAGEKEPLKVMRLKRMESVEFQRRVNGCAWDIADATAELTLFLAWERGLGT